MLYAAVFIDWISLLFKFDLVANELFTVATSSTDILACAFLRTDYLPFVSYPMVKH